MATISVIKQSNSKPNQFCVTVKEGDSSTKHTVHVNEALYQSLTQGKTSKEDCLKASFEFLLERESKEAIMSQFDLSIISTYFPEYENEIKHYL